jgi:hypothetical protein
MKLILAAVAGAKWKRSLDVLGTEVKKKDVAKLEVLSEGKGGVGHNKPGVRRAASFPHQVSRVRHERQ